MLYEVIIRLYGTEMKFIVYGANPTRAKKNLLNFLKDGGDPIEQVEIKQVVSLKANAVQITDNLA